MAYYRCGGGVPSAVKALPTYKTASGSVATFETDLTENLVEVKCQIVAKQASGTPSPSTPLPISGVSAVNVTRTGKNLVSTANITDVVYNDQGQIRKGFIIRSGGTFTISVQRAYTNATYIFVKALNADGTFGAVQYVIQGTTTADKTLTIETGGALLVYSSETASLFETIVNYCELQIEQGNEATAFEPFGTTATCNLGDTYYNGSVDVVTGKINNSKNKVVVGTSGWSKFGNFFFKAFADKQRTTTADEYPLVCSMLENGGTVSASGQMTNTYIYQFSTNDNIYIYDSSCADETAFYSKYSACEILYQLATPTTAYASNTLEIPTINGTNNLFADTGDVTAKYILSVGEALRQAV